MDRLRVRRRDSLLMNGLKSRSLAVALVVNLRKS
jgi:hypothetical protein